MEAKMENGSLVVCSDDDTNVVRYGVTGVAKLSAVKGEAGDEQLTLRYAR